MTLEEFTKELKALLRKAIVAGLDPDDIGQIVEYTIESDINGELE